LASQKTKVYNFALLGFPVEHSVSPQIHNEFLRVLGLKGSYSLVETEPQTLVKNIRALQQLGFSGINLTIPHKESVFEVLDSFSFEANLIQAVNTLVLKKDKIFGENTDWLGFLESLPKDFLKNQENLKVCVLGAGGSAKAVLLALLKINNLQELCFVTRKSQSREKNLRRLNSIVEKTEKSIKLRNIYFDDLPKTQKTKFNLVINTTPIGLASQEQELSPVNQEFIDRSCLKTQCLFYDLIYNPVKTKFLKLAEKNKLKTINGYKMLKIQAAYSFKLWTARKNLDFLSF